MIYDYYKYISKNLIVRVLCSLDDGKRIEAYKSGRTECEFLRLPGNIKVALAKTLGPAIDLEFDRVVKRSNGKPLKSPLNNKDEMVSFHKTVTDSWNVNLPFSGGNLRDAQIGAIYGCLSHWTKKNDPAIVVLPTGTGKTEALFALIAIRKPKKVMIVVPTDPLRLQIFNKLIVMGKLRDWGVLNNESLNPVVGMINHKFSDKDSFLKFSTHCQILIGTAQAISTIESNWITESGIEFLAVDEAHHLPAKTWSGISKKFDGKTKILFTATPFRNDGKHMEGDVIYNYPISKCQELGIFRKIHFFPVDELLDEKKDRAIAEKAIERLKEMYKKGFSQVIMARVKSISRAKEITSLYKRYRGIEAEYLYSSMANTKKRAIKESLLSGNLDVIVCVNMLGEGFDFAPLKIAAIHDAHKSLPVILQFIGRFIRDAAEDPGDASVVVNTADEATDSAIGALYSQDADWNELIQSAYEDAVGKEIEFQEFIQGFVNDGIQGFSLRNIKPVYSTFIYSYEGDVQLRKLSEEFNDGKIYRTSINPKENIAVVVQRTDERVKWGNISHLIETAYDCHCIYVHEGHKLIFIFSTQNDAQASMANCVASNVIIRRGDESLLRCLSGISRMLLTNVGLKQQLAGPVRYRSYIGMDVAQGLRDRSAANSYTAMIFGAGFEGGERANIGCSLKGKVWSKNGGSLIGWKNWCDHIGQKLVDDSISIDEIMKGVLVPKVIGELPHDRTIISIDWSDFFFEGNSCDRTVFEYIGKVVEFWDCELILQGISEDRKHINFSISSLGEDIGYVLNLGTEPEGYSITLQPGCNDLSVKSGRSILSGTEFFQKNPPIFWLDNIGCLTEGCIYVTGYEPEIGTFTADELITWDWKDVKINKESQGPDKKSETIQYYVVQNIDRNECELLFDDDDRGEAADVVAIYNKDDTIEVYFYHLKFSRGNPGRRIDDLYQVCGQAQKSIRWAGCTERLLDHLKDRESRRQELHPGKSRIEHGTNKSFRHLRAFIKAKRVKYNMVIVQPGLSKAKMYDGSEEALAILRLFGATRMYLEETYGINLSVICSA